MKKGLVSKEKFIELYEPFRMISVKKGQWFAICCEDDLMQSEEDFEEEKRFMAGVWNTKEEALKELTHDPFAWV